MEDLRKFYVGVIPAPLSFRAGNYVREETLGKRGGFLLRQYFIKKYKVKIWRTQ